jgi:predicted DNA-binding transcriptional regulator AlpA
MGKLQSTVAARDHRRRGDHAAAEQALRRGALPPLLVTFPELKSIFGVPWCRDHVRRLVREGKFPAPIAISEARIAWRSADVEAWLELCAVAVVTGV